MRKREREGAGYIDNPLFPPLPISDVRECEID